MITNNSSADYRLSSPCELVFTDSKPENSYCNAPKQECQYDENLLNSIIRVEHGFYEGPSATSVENALRRFSPDKRIFAVQDITTKITERKTLKPFDEHGTEVQSKKTAFRISDWNQERLSDKKQTNRPDDSTIDSFGFHNNSFSSPVIQCDMENDRTFRRLDPNFSPKLTFVDPLFAQRKSRYIVKPASLEVVIKKISKLSETPTASKIYKCPICYQTFSKPAALGGHKARWHPGTSETYRKRVNTKKYREQQRNKQKYLHQL
jgi:hypothetical protein